MVGMFGSDNDDLNDPPLLITFSRMELLGMVLAGGASRRMGNDKAALCHHGVPEIRRIAAAVRAVTGSVYGSLGRGRIGDPLFDGLPVLLDVAHHPP